MKKKDPIEEARRYVDNAKETLRDKGEYNEELNRYDDEKYVRAAGNYLWLGVLMALDAVFQAEYPQSSPARVMARIIWTQPPLARFRSSR